MAVVASVHADLDRRGAAHHLAAPRALAVEEFLHRGVPRQIEQAAGRAQRVKAVAAQFQAGCRGRVTQRGQVTPGHLDELTERSGGGRAELKLPARLYCERGTRRKRRGFIPNGLGFLPRVTFLVRAAEPGQGGGYLFRLDRERGIAAITCQPLEFDAHTLRRARLEADSVNMRFRVGFGKPRPLYHDFNPT